MHSRNQDAKSSFSWTDKIGIWYSIGIFERALIKKFSFGNTINFKSNLIRSEMIKVGMYKFGIHCIFSELINHPRTVSYSLTSILSPNKYNVKCQCLLQLKSEVIMNCGARVGRIIFFSFENSCISSLLAIMTLRPRYF